MSVTAPAQFVLFWRPSAGLLAAPAQLTEFRRPGACLLYLSELHSLPDDLPLPGPSCKILVSGSSW